MNWARMKAYGKVTQLKQELLAIIDAWAKDNDMELDTVERIEFSTKLLELLFLKWPKKKRGISHYNDGYHKGYLAGLKKATGLLPTEEDINTMIEESMDRVIKEVQEKQGE